MAEVGPFLQKWSHFGRNGAVSKWSNFGQKGAVSEKWPHFGQNGLTPGTTPGLNSFLINSPVCAARPSWNGPRRARKKLWGHLEVLFSSLKSHPAKFNQKTGYGGPRKVFWQPKRVWVSVGAVGLLEVYVGWTLGAHKTIAAPFYPPQNHLPPQNLGPKYALVQQHCALPKLKRVTIPGGENLP